MLSSLVSLLLTFVFLLISLVLGVMTGGARRASMLVVSLAMFIMLFLSLRDVLEFT